MIGEFLYRQPVEIHFGRGKFDGLTALLASKGIRRALIVCQNHLAPTAEDALCALFTALQ